MPEKDFARARSHKAHLRLLNARGTVPTHALFAVLTRQMELPARWDPALLAQLGLPLAWCTPRISHVELSGLRGAPTKYRVCAIGREQSPLSGACARGIREGLCASGHEQSLYRAPALVVTEMGLCASRLTRNAYQRISAETCVAIAMSSMCVRARANRSSVSGCIQAHVQQVPHLSSKLSLLTKLIKKCAKACACYLCGAHRAKPLSRKL